MTYRSAIESRARHAADAARTEVLITELRMLEHELPLARTDRWAGEGEVEDMERAVRWLRRTLKMPVSPEERRERQGGLLPRVENNASAAHDDSTLDRGTEESP